MPSTDYGAAVGHEWRNLNQSKTFRSRSRSSLDRLFFFRIKDLALHYEPETEKYELYGPLAQSCHQENDTTVLPGPSHFGLDGLDP